MVDNQSKMPLTRQVRYYKQSRDNWRENAAKKQRKMREYFQLNRALTQSREQWKEKAKQAKERAEKAEEKVKELEKKLENLEKKLGRKTEKKSCSSLLNETNQVDCHHYRLTTIKISIEKIEERLREKFRWLASYEAKIPLWITRLNMTRTLEK